MNEHLPISKVHTCSAVMGWAACDRLANAARAIGLEERETYWNDRAAIMRRKILDNALRSESACLSAVFKGDTCDASLLQLLDLRFMPAEDPHYLATLEVTERDLRRGSVMFRYSAPDDFGTPVTAIHISPFCLIEAFHRNG